MSENKTVENDASVEEFLDSIASDVRREECRQVLVLMREATGIEPKMWGTAIVGFGNYPYKTAAGRTGEWFIVGFSPRKQNLTLYFCPSLSEHGDLLERLGKHTTGVSCLYLKKLADADPAVLREMVLRSAASMAAR